MVTEVSRTQKTVRTTMGLRDAMFDELDALRSGESTPKRAAAAARLAGAIVNSVKIEIDHQKHVATLSSIGDSPANTATLKLGNGEEVHAH